MFEYEIKYINDPLQDIFVVALVIYPVKTFISKIFPYISKKDMMFVWKDNYERRKPSPMKYENTS